MSVRATATVLNAYGFSAMRLETDAPSQCPQCSSHRLSFDPRPNREPREGTVCNAGGWTERSRPIRRTRPTRNALYLCVGVSITFTVRAVALLVFTVA